MCSRDIYKKRIIFFSNTFGIAGGLLSFHAKRSNSIASFVTFQWMRFWLFFVVQRRKKLSILNEEENRFFSLRFSLPQLKYSKHRFRFSRRATTKMLDTTHQNRDGIYFPMVIIIRALGCVWLQSHWYLFGVYYYKTFNRYKHWRKKIKQKHLCMLATKRTPILAWAWNFQKTEKQRNFRLRAHFLVAYWKVCQNAQSLFALDKRMRDIWHFLPCKTAGNEAARITQFQTCTYHWTI